MYSSLCSIDSIALCLLSYFCNEFINDWYNEIKDMFIPVIARGGFRNVEEAERVKIYRFITQSRYVPLANTLSLRLSRIITDWNETGQLSRVINTREDIDKLLRLQESLSLFIVFAAEKIEWYRNVTNPSRLQDVDIQCVEEWRSRLWDQSIKVNTWKDELGDNLKCREANMRELIKNYGRSKGKIT
jgi:hypothetical protein